VPFTVSPLIPVVLTSTRAHLSPGCCAGWAFWVRNPSYPLLEAVVLSLMLALPDCDYFPRVLRSTILSPLWSPPQTRAFICEGLACSASLIISGFVCRPRHDHQSEQSLAHSRISLALLRRTVFLRTTEASLDHHLQHLLFSAISVFILRCLLCYVIELFTV